MNANLTSFGLEILKFKFLKIPSLIFGFFSIYEFLTSYTKPSKCTKPLRIEIDINFDLTSVYW